MISSSSSSSSSSMIISMIKGERIPVARLDGEPGGAGRRKNQSYEA